MTTYRTAREVFDAQAGGHITVEQAQAELEALRARESLGHAVMALGIGREAAMKTPAVHYNELRYGHCPHTPKAPYASACNLCCIDAFATAMEDMREACARTLDEHPCRYEGLAEVIRAIPVPK